MEEQDISMPNLRSRSRSKTPLPIMRDADQAGTEKSANSRNTPLHMDTEVIHEEPAEEIFTSPPAHRTRNALKSKTPQTSSALHSQDTTQKQHTYLSSEEVQNIKNYSYEYEHIATSQTISLNGSRSLLDSGRDGSRVHSSLSGSDYSTESFAESVLADSSRLSVEEGIQHLPYKVYKCAVEYWNKYPKTDYTYSRLSKDRVELAPGQVAVPNMSRPALHSVRHSISTQDICTASGTSSLLSESELRQRWITNTRNSRRIDTMSDSEVDEIDNWRQTYSGLKKDNRWRITKLIIAIWTYIVTTTTTIKSKIFGSDHSDRYRHANNYYTYTSMTTNKSIFSSTTEAMKQKRFWLPLLLLFLLLPALFLLYTKPEYKQHFTSSIQNLTNILIVALPNNLTLPEFNFHIYEFFKQYSLSNVTLPSISLLNISIPSSDYFNNLNFSETYNEYKSVANAKIINASEFIQIVGQQWFHELQKLWDGIIT